MEQFLGAILCFSGFILFKAWASRSSENRLETSVAYVPRMVTRIGFAVLPLVIAGLLWWLGIRDVALILVTALFVAAQTIAAARVRAETGMPTTNVSYDYTKLPMILGMTTMTGAKTFTNYIATAFMPVSLLFRTLPQQLENIELARRHKVHYGTIALSSLVAFVAALAIGMMGFLILTYFVGEVVWAEGLKVQGPNGFSIARAPLWISHFQGETGLSQFNLVQWHRVAFGAIGFTVVLALLLLRTFYLRFPIHPIGYLLMLFSIYYTWASPYYKGAEGDASAGKEQTWLWAGFFLAWLIKWLTIKYGGMNTYKRVKPLFIGLVVGSVLAIFCWNMVDLGYSIWAESVVEPSELMKKFTEKPPYSPKVY